MSVCVCLHVVFYRIFIHICMNRRQEEEKRLVRDVERRRSDAMKQNEREREEKRHS